MSERLKLVFVGLSLSSAWGNGHATTYRSLLRGLAALGHEAHFLERDVSWYADHRDLEDPDFAALHLYDEPGEFRRLMGSLADADAFIIGSFVPDGVEVIDLAVRFDPAMLCFYDIDTPVTLAKLEQRDEEYLARRQIPFFDLYFSFSGGTVLDRLEARYHARRARALYCSVDPDRYSPTGEEPEWDLGYLGTYSPDRQPALERLLIEPARRLPHRRFIVAGSQYPPDIDWPANVERIQHLPPAKHASFYSRQKFALNVTRAEMVELGWSPSVRLFEAAACATPIISDRWTGLTDLLPEDEAIFIADTTEEVVRLLQDTTADKRRSVASAAREIVLSSHTGKARARELVDHLTSVRLGRTSSRVAQAV
jgi:spore maturation protein CgeB